jgi:tRNA-modifying protein YgfZ
MEFAVHSPLLLMQQQLNGMTPLTHLGVIRAQGDDAARFLHGQLTNDFLQLDISQARLAGFCNPQGRLLASFVGFKRGPTDILLVCSQDILPATLKRLSMFVMRAKLKLSDASAEFALFGVAGPALASSGIDHACPPFTKSDVGCASVIHLHLAGGVARVLWVTPKDGSCPAGEVLDAGLWAWSEVRSGITTITAPIVDTFVPQMINYESVGGVNFRKGCYPGQEVIARSQFRGSIKRKAYLAHKEQMLQVGDMIFGMDDAQPRATVAQVAASPSGGCDAIVSMPIADFEQSKILAAAYGGVTLTHPPYPFLTDI